MGFFEELKIFSERVFKELGFAEKQSPWQSKFKFGFPTGVVLHYTTGVDPIKTVSWFMRKKWESKLSAHIVIANGLMKRFSGLADDLPLVQRLPATVIQCVPTDKAAVHATWTNSSYYGIELVNAGEIRCVGNKYFMAAEDWTEEWKIKKIPRSVFGRLWEPYSQNQIVSAAFVIRQLMEKYGEAFDPKKIIGHEHVSWVKSDPGPLFPINAFRDRIFSSASLDTRYDEDISYRILEERVIKKLNYGAADIGDVKRALAALGYYTDYDMPCKYSVRVFQRMAKITKDGIPGPITQKKILARLRDRGIISE